MTHILGAITVLGMDVIQGVMITTCRLLRRSICKWESVRQAREETRLEGDRDGVFQSLSLETLEASELLVLFL